VEAGLAPPALLDHPIAQIQYRSTFLRGAPWEAAQNRAALLQRGLIFAQRALWPGAIDERASALAEGASLSAPERRLSETVIRSELTLLSLSGDRELAKRVKRLYAAGGFGGQVVFAMMRAFVWNI